MMEVIKEVSEMSTRAQRRANRQNSLASTGPRSDRGKQIAAMNSTRHGLTSQQVVLNTESQEEYDALKAGLRNSHHPANEQEELLVKEIADCSWRLQRTRKIEHRLFSVYTSIFGTDPEPDDKNVLRAHTDPDAALLLAWKKQSDELEKLRRYSTTIERTYFRAIDTLVKLQKQRVVAGHARPIGFASQNSGTGIPAGEIPIHARSVAATNQNIGVDRRESAADNENPMYPESPLTRRV